MGAKIIDRETKKNYNSKNLSPELEKIFTADNQELRDNYYNNVVSDYIYGYTNENLDNLFDALNLSKKKVLVVGSSGDQALYSILNGAKKVVLADANIFTRSFVELKMAAMKELSIDEFIEYFRKLYMNFFENHSVYAKISHHLSPKVQNFWDTIMIDGDANTINSLFMNCVQENADWCKFYRDENEYKKLQNALKKGEFELKFVYEDVKNFHNEFKERFDLILLSNVYDYASKYDFMFSTSFLYDFNLKHGGAIQFSSTYDEKDTQRTPSQNDFDVFFKDAKFCAIKKAGLVFDDSLMIQKPFKTKTTKKPVIDEKNENVKQM